MAVILKPSISGIVRIQDDKNLDNPVWFSLSESHQNFAVDYDNIKFYHPDYCTFGGFENVKHISKHIDEYSTMVDNFFVVGKKPELSKALKLKQELVCLQMIINKRIDVEIKEMDSRTYYRIHRWFISIS